MFGSMNAGDLYAPSDSFYLDWEKGSTWDVVNITGTHITPELAKIVN